MSLIGVVCEYNPFHNGHEYHLRESRQGRDDAGVVCVMSGDFVQRGEPAIYSKFARAEAACFCGADVVFELPLPWSLASAEGFARGAAGLLAALGADTLSFGTEAESLKDLDFLAGRLIEPETIDLICEKQAQDATLSFAAARQAALEDLCGPAARLLEEPNNILAVEYLKAIRTMRLELTPLAVRRVGSAHDGDGEGNSRSASALRSLLRSGRSAAEFMPAAAAAVFERDTEMGRGMPSKEVLETAMLSRLRMLDAARCAALPDASGGLGERLLAAAAEEPTMDALIAAVKNKRVAMSRVRRVCCCAALGVESGMATGIPPYARLLALTARGREILAEIKKTSRVPILTKPAAVRELGGESLRIFSLGAAAHDLYALGYRAQEERRGGADWRSSPRLIE
ncbi:MAG: nucleotidyltransferase family protein [Oscillospiraceae bacterium]|nr:nucleotidyltransferase family protein [Oscillospiraceae bacterium]